MNLNLFSEFFEISESSPSGLIWIKDYFANSGARFGFKGRIAGRQYDKGYWRIGFKSQRYEVHRIVYLLANKSIDENLEVDHIDGDPSNNRVINLRLVSKIENLSNRRQKSMTGVTGVYINKRRNSICSHWQDSGVTKCSKSFNVEELGLDEAIKRAKSVRNEEIAKLQQK